MFPLPRVLYAMASDGIVYKDLQKINSKTKTPLFATVCAGLLSAIMSLFFDLHQLIDMMSIGTLIAYTIVAVCVLVLRYEYEDKESAQTIEMPSTVGQIVRQIFNLNLIKRPNRLSANITKTVIVAFSVISIFLCIMIDRFNGSNIYFIIGFTIVAIALISALLIIVRQPVSDTELAFKVPLVPMIPCLSIFINLYLMFQLDLQTWIRFLIWGIIGKLNVNKTESLLIN